MAFLSPCFTFGSECWPACKHPRAALLPPRGNGSGRPGMPRCTTLLAVARSAAGCMAGAVSLSVAPTGLHCIDRFGALGTGYTGSSMGRMGAAVVVNARLANWVAPGPALSSQAARLEPVASGLMLRLKAMRSSCSVPSISVRRARRTPRRIDCRSAYKA